MAAGSRELVLTFAIVRYLTANIAGKNGRFFWREIIASAFGYETF